VWQEYTPTAQGVYSYWRVTGVYSYCAREEKMDGTWKQLWMDSGIHCPRGTVYHPC
jgi:hypothetical protein